MKVLVTAGPTHEPIDPVRFIGNRSSGKMGIAIAEIFAQKGNEVYLIKGPTHLHAKNPSIHTIEVETALEMFDACQQYFDQSDVVVFAAAVADYTPRFPQKTKIKKQAENIQLELIRTKDIAAELGKRKSTQFHVGFALETDNEMENAKKKLEEKRFDMVVLNSMRDEGAGFQGDTNKVTILDKRGNIAYFDLKSKDEVALDIVNYVSEMLSTRQ